MKSLLLIFLLLSSSCYLTPSQFTEECLTPPETLRDMEKITKDVSDSLNELKITHWLDWGTLLGAYRFGSHMPYDDDVDFGVVRGDYQALKAELRVCLAKKGYGTVNWDVDPNGDNIPQIFFQAVHNRPHLDLFLFEKSKNSWRYSSNYWHKTAKHAGHQGLGFPASAIFNPDGSLGKIRLLEQEYNVPVGLDAYFKRLYLEPKILTNFVMSRVHGEGICANGVAIKDIKKHPKVLNKLFDHLEKVYEGRFKRTESRLY